MQNPSAFFNTLQQPLPAILSKLQDLDAEALARQSGFLERSPRKIPMRDFLLGLLALAPQPHLSLEDRKSVV